MLLAVNRNDMIPLPEKHRLPWDVSLPAKSLRSLESRKFIFTFHGRWDLEILFLSRVSEAFSLGAKSTNVSEPVWGPRETLLVQKLGSTRIPNGELPGSWERETFPGGEAGFYKENNGD